MQEETQLVIGLDVWEWNKWQGRSWWSMVVLDWDSGFVDLLTLDREWKCKGRRWSLQEKDRKWHSQFGSIVKCPRTLLYIATYRRMGGVNGNCREAFRGSVCVKVPSERQCDPPPHHTHSAAATVAMVTASALGHSQHQMWEWGRIWHCKACLHAWSMSEWMNGISRRTAGRVGCCRLPECRP